MPLVDDLRAHLMTRLPAEVTEVLLPAMVLQPAPGGVRAEARNAAWLEVWRELAATEAQEWLGCQPGHPTLISVAGGEAATGGEVASFDGFVADPGNQVALAAARRVVEAPGLEHNPLYLHGGSGTGKTHLLTAIVQEFRSMLGEGAAVVLDGPSFVTSHAPELARREATPLREALAATACIAIDGIDALAGRDLAQEELFHLLNDALDRGVQVVVTGRVPPGRLTPCSERLSSRLAWGLVIGLDPPQIETRIAVVLRRGGPAARGMDPADLAALVEARAPDLHQAVALADHLAHHGSAPRSSVVSFDRIIATVAHRYRLRPGDLTGKRRDREAAQARGIALLLGRRLTRHSLQALGGMVGGRDHATVLHALHTTEERLEQDPEIRRAYEELARLVVT